MTSNVIIDMSDPQRSLGFHIYLSDFANVLKTFIGSNFLSIPFGLKLCGLGLGVGSLVLIGIFTAHCCHLLIKCRYHAIDHICNLYRKMDDSQYHVCPTDRGLSLREDNAARYEDSLIFDHLVSSAIIDRKVKKSEADLLKLRKQLLKNIRYGDLAHMCFGRFGFALVNFLILLTQLGFTTNYVIFTANTLYGFFPVYNCTAVGRGNETVSLTPDCRYLAHSPWHPTPSYEERDNFSDSNFLTELLQSDSTAVNPDGRNESIMMDGVTEYNSTTIQSFLEHAANLSTDNIVVSPLESAGQTTKAYLKFSDHISFTASVLAELGTNSSLTLDFAEHSTVVSSHVFAEPVVGNVSVWTKIWTNAPDLRLFVVVPVVVFMVLVLPRSIRGLGVISVIGNVGIMSGVLLVLAALVAQFQISESWQWSRLEGLPVFFGTVASAFEGAGIILPVEAAMDGNHHNFPCLLYMSVGIVLLIYEGVCVLSYLTFGDSIDQMVTMNITSGSGMSVAVNVCLMVGIICTFPLMVFPVVSIVERALFGPDGLCNRKTDAAAEKSPLLPSCSEPDDKYLTKSNPKKSRKNAPWKRNVIGIALVVMLGGLGVALRDSFAYISAFIGALGSTMVAYILPCLFHLRLCWPHLPFLVKVKDVVIIVAGLIFTVTGVYAVISSML